jgi:hypothetical protein
MKWKVIAASITLGVLLSACADREAPARGAEDGATGGNGEATGDEYAAELGLVAHPYDESMKLATSEEGVTLDGTLLEGCGNRPDVQVSMAILESGTIYCYTWTDELEAWIISQRLQGHIPSQEEISAREEELARN